MQMTFRESSIARVCLRKSEKIAVKWVNCISSHVMASSAISVPPEWLVARKVIESESFQEPQSNFEARTYEMSR